MTETPLAAFHSAGGMKQPDVAPLMPPRKTKRATLAPAESAFRTQKQSGSANYSERARLLAALRRVTQKETKYRYGALGVKQTGGVQQGFLGTHSSWLTMGSVYPKGEREDTHPRGSAH